MANTPGEQEDEAFLRADLGGPATAHSQGRSALGWPWWQMLAMHFCALRPSGL